MARAKIGRVSVQVGAGGEVVGVDGTALEPEQVEIVVEEVGTADPSDLTDPFSLTLEETP